MLGASSVSFYKSPVISCSMSGRTSRSPFTIFLLTSNHALHFLRTSLVGSTTLSMTYSIKVQPYNDPYIKIAEEAVESISELMIPGAFLVDVIPILKYVPEWFPGAKFHSKAAVMRKHASIMRNTTFAATEELMVCDSDLSPFFGFLVVYMYTFLGQRWLSWWSLFRHRSTKRYATFRHPWTRYYTVERCCCPGVFGLVRPFYILFFRLTGWIPGGADTAASAIGTFFLAMVCYPEVQKEAQAEIDKVLNGRLPEHSDFPSLPYLSALIKEVYRYAAVYFECPLLPVDCVSSWKPILPLGRSQFVSNKGTSWHPCLVKAARVGRPAMMSTMTIISLPTLLWLPTNGDGHLLPITWNIELSSFSKFYFIGRCRMTNGIIQSRTYSSPSAFWRMDNSTVQLETRWTSHLDSVGGVHFIINSCLFF